MKKQGKPIVVGFYKDHSKTKPITKSVAELNRKKIVKGPHKFKGVVARVRDTTEILNDLLGELHLAQDHLVVLGEQQKQLSEQGKVSPLLDKEAGKTREHIAVLKVRIRGLGS